MGFSSFIKKYIYGDNMSDKNSYNDYNNYLDQLIVDRKNLIKFVAPNPTRKDEILTGGPSNTEALLKKYDASGSPLYNNGLIISSLCPFNNTFDVDPEIIENIDMPNEDLPILPHTDRVEYIKSWLNLIWRNEKVLDSMLVELPFSRYEVALPALGIKKNPKFNYVRRDLLFYLDKLFERLVQDTGIKKLHITSAYRSPEYNALIRYSDFDSHIIGCAVDITGNQDLIDKINSYASSIGFGGIGVGKNIIHLDLNAKSNWKY